MYKTKLEQARLMDLDVSVPNNWVWLIFVPVGAYFAVLLVWLFNIFFQPLNPEFKTYIVYVYILFSFLSPIAIYFDRQTINPDSEWKPSAVYYLAGFPLQFNVLIQILYIYKRLKYA